MHLLNRGTPVVTIEYTNGNQPQGGCICERKGEGKVTGIKEFGIGLVREYSELRTRTSDRFHQEKNKLRRDSIEMGPPSLRRSSLKEEPDNPILHCILVPHSG